MTTRPNYTNDFVARHAAEQEAARLAKEELAARNERAGAVYQQGLADKRKAEDDRMAAQFDAKVAPTKEKAKRQWLYDHPDRTETDFETQAWPLLRANLEDEAKTAIKDRYLAQAGYRA